MDDFKPLDLFGDGIATKTDNGVSDDDNNNSDTQVSSNQTAQGEKIDTDEVSSNVDKEDDTEQLVVTDGAMEDEKSSDDLSERKDDTDAVNEKLGILETACEQITAQLSELHLLFDKRIMHAEYEDKIIDQMHAELQKYKDDMYSQLIRPILLDIIEVRDSILRIAATYQKKPEGEQDIPNKTFADYSYDLQDILERNNIEIYRSSQGDDFTPIKQRVIKKEVTHDETLHGKVAESLSSGYSYLGRVISAEKVSVYYYEKVEETITESEENVNG